MTSTGKELDNSPPIKSNCLNAHANYAWLRGDVLETSVPPVSRYPSPGYFVEPGDSHDHIEIKPSSIEKT
jgi:hypothetical protein